VFLAGAEQGIPSMHTGVIGDRVTTPLSRRYPCKDATRRVAYPGAAMKRRAACLELDVDAELAELDDRSSAPSDSIG